MAVSVNDLIVGPLTPALGVTTISIDFYFEQAAWLQVYKSGSETPLILNTDYTVTGAGTGSGVVTLTEAADGVSDYTVYLVVPLQRSSDMQTRGGFQSEPFNLEMDRLWQALQRQSTLGQRSFRVGATATAPAPYVPEPETVMGFDASGETVLYPVNQSVMVAPDPVGVVRFKTVALVLSDTTMGYTGSASVAVAAGDYVLTTEEGLSYKVAASGASDHHVTAAGGVKLYVLAWTNGYDVRAFGAVGDGVADDTAEVQKAVDVATAGKQSVYAPGGPYLITTINVTCHLIGTINNRFASGATTFTSAVGAGVYAVRITNWGGRLENVTVRNTGAGNGIDCNLCGTSTVLKDVSTSTTFARVTGSGSIGVNFGTDATSGQQAITAVFSAVNSRDYDICFRMRYYSNSNTYQQLYALATDNTAQPATAGFLVNGRGATFISCNAESNFLYLLKEDGTPNGAEENTYINFWGEGIVGTQITLNGIGSTMINPYGFVGGAGGSVSIPITKSAYASVIKNRGPSNSGDQIAMFDDQGVNLVRNADLSIDLGGLSWSNAVMAGSTLFGKNAVSIESASAVTTVTSDLLLNYIDLDVHTWLRGKTITMACFGQAEAGANLSIRGIVRTAAGSNLQYATSNSFPEGSPGYRSISLNIPTDPATAKYIVFRMYGSGVTAATPSKAGRVAMPMVYLGNKQNDVAARPLSDGANTTYGNLTFHGGGWNGAHILLGAYHLWVDSTGDLRIKSGAPASDTDGTVVGTQT